MASGPLPEKKARQAARYQRDVGFNAPTKGRAGTVFISLHIAMCSYTGKGESHASVSKHLLLIPNIRGRGHENPKPVILKPADLLLLSRLKNLGHFCTACLPIPDSKEERKRY